tara:strand:+ start:2983 stop:3906 length:924 start_codon:yes stop_codon:yes gene_type:complete
MNKFKLESLGSLHEKPKVCLVGDSGAGKTHALLSLPGNKILVDAENGMRAFGERFPEVTRLGSDDPMEVADLIHSILAGNEDCTLFGIDPISTIYAQAQDMVGAHEMRRLRSRSGGKNVDPLDHEFSFATWRRIKSLNRAIITGIRRLDIPVVVTCRSKALMDVANRSDAFNGMIPDAEKSIIYEFDVVIWMTNQNGKRRAFVTKDRWGRLPAEIKGDVHEALIKAFPDQWGVAGEARPIPSDEQVDEWDELIGVLNISAGGVSAALRQRGVTKFEDMSPEAAETVLEALRAKAGRSKVETEVGSAV